MGEGPWAQLAETPAAAAQLLDDLVPKEHACAAFELLILGEGALKVSPPTCLYLSAQALLFL